MLSNQPLKDKIPYNLITTFVFIGIVLGLPAFFYYLSPGWAFEPYGVIPLVFGSWVFLREPYIQIKRRKMEVLSSKYPDLANQITALSVYTNLRNRPIVMYIPAELPEVFSFGTWRKKYIAISEGAINRWSDPATIMSVITHEIAHIADGDIWKAGFPLYFMYWFFGAYIFIFLYTFPYSLFFKIFSPFRLSNGYPDLITSFTLLILNFAILLAIRFLFRMKEYAADAFSVKHISMADYVKAFVAPIAKNNSDYKKKRTAKEYFQNKISRALTFHPSIQARLTALQSPLYLISELPSLMFVVGIFAGIASCYFLDLNKSFALTLISEITFGFLSVAMLLNFQTLRERLLISRQNYIENTFSLANGVAFAFLVLVGVNNLLVNQKDGVYGFSMVIRQGVELKDALFSTFDVLLLIMILAPIVILILIFAAWLIINACSVNGFTWKPILLSSISIIPAISLLDFYILQWWKGSIITFSEIAFLLPAYLLWILVVVLFWRLVSRRQRNVNAEGI